MELIIRSQDKATLIKCNNLTIEEYMDNHVDIRTYQDDGASFRLGKYSSRDRALFVLDEIQSKIKQQFICKIHPLISKADEKRIKEELSKDYIGDFMISTPTMDIQPINPNILIYEMPEDR